MAASNIRRRLGTAAAAMLLATLVLAAGCTPDAPDEADKAGSPANSPTDRPLAPLVYTEDPDHTPEGAAARERRLLRQLEAGANARDARWGAMTTEQPTNLPTLDSPEKLGEALFGAIIESDEALWDHVFVNPAAYASLVHLELDKARTFVDRQQGEAAAVREAFNIDKPSEAPTDGLGEIFTFRKLELGEGRTVDGPVADDDEIVAQHWDNKLQLGLADEEVTFVIHIPKIVRMHPGGHGADQKATLAVASRMRVGSRLRVYLEAGMHLKSKLLDSAEYPIPLAVGNFWRYRRRPAEDDTDSKPETTDETSETDESATAPSNPADSVLRATRVTTTVVSVDHFGSRRLVHLRHSYNDADLRHATEYWLVTPRRIFRCPHGCRRHVDELDWLLAYLRRQTPVMRFPLALGDRWPESAETPTFRVADTWSNVEVPAGAFFGALAIDGLGGLEGRLPFGDISELRRYFAPGKGIVKRRYRHADRTVVEALVDYRIMPRN